jgi:hypothetical protein
MRSSRRAGSRCVENHRNWWQADFALWEMRYRFLPFARQKARPGTQQLYPAARSVRAAGQRRPHSQGNDGVQAVEALDGPRHATLPLNKHCQRQGGRGFGSMARPARRGHRRHVYEGAERGPSTLRGRTLTGGPLNPGRPGPGFRRTAMPESQTPAHPGARDVPTRKRQARSAWQTAPQAPAQPLSPAAAKRENT